MAASSPVPPATFDHSQLSMRQIRAIQEQVARATSELAVVMGNDEPSLDAFCDCLQRGACFESLALPVGKANMQRGTTRNIWQAIITLGRLDFFNALLDADAVRTAPVSHTAGVVAMVAASGRLDFLDALIARGTPLNQRGRVSMLGVNQNVSGLAGPLMVADDAALDRLLDAGAEPNGAVEPPVYDTEPKYRVAPLTLIHIAHTPHAVRRLVAAGLDPDACDEHGRNALELAFDAMSAALRTGTSSADRSERIRVAQTQAAAMVDALLDAGASPTGGWRRPAWTPLVGAAHHDVVPLMTSLQKRGLTWPAATLPDSPQEAVRIIEHGLPLPLVESGTAWLLEWVKPGPGGGSFWHQQEERDSLRRLRLQGLDLNGLDPSVVVTPLVAALRVGAYNAVIGLIEAGADVDGYPGGAWHPRVTWRQLLSKTIYGVMSTNSHWTKFTHEQQRFGKGEKLAEALKVLGHHPAIVAELQRVHLEMSLSDTVVKKNKTRL